MGERKKMGLLRLTKIYCINRCPKPPLFRIVFVFLLLSFFSLVLNKVDDIATRIVTQTKTLAGHNLNPTPWHRRFPRKVFNDGNNTYTKALKLLKCTYFSCPSATTTPSYHHHHHHHHSQNISSPKCPSFFQWIHQDLDPWARSRITQAQMKEARRFAAFRVVIVNGRLYVDYYYDCTQTRAMFTIWGLVQLLRRYPGMVPDVDMMFDCMDRPFVERRKYNPGKRWPPPPLFRYCTDDWHFDIPFPDWSFWGWPETNIQPWDEEFRSIKRGSAGQTWSKKVAHAYWKGNPFVGARVRMDLLRCNDSNKWGAEVFIQDWLKEEKAGYKQSNLADQCRHRYKIYAEGFAWSVSLKYVLSCGSLTLLISPKYQDFFSRGLIPKENYWPVARGNLCQSIKYVVEWANSNAKQAEAIGKGGEDLMNALNMERVYDYMYHLIKEYSKLQDFKPTPPPSAQEVCAESVLCLADPRSRQFLEWSTANRSSSPPCVLPTADHTVIESWIRKKWKVISDVQEMEDVARRNKTSTSSSP